MQRALDGGKEILQKLERIILISFPAGKLFPSWGPLVLPNHSFPGSPRTAALCWDPIMCWIRPGGFSTPQGHQSGTSGGQRDEPSLLQVPTQDTSDLGQQCHLHSFLSAGRSWECSWWGERRDATFSLPSETSQPLYLDHSWFLGCF